MEPIIEIVFDEAKLRNVEKMLKGIPRALPRVVSMAINHTITPVRTDMARRLTPQVNAELATIESMQKAASRKVAKRLSPKTGKTKHFRFKISTIKANIRFYRATHKRWMAALWIKQFKGQEAQATAQTAFIQKMKSGHISIFRRLGVARIPIADQLRRLMRRYFMGIAGSIRRLTEVRLVKNMEFYVKQELDKWTKGASSAA